MSYYNNSDTYCYNCSVYGSYIASFDTYACYNCLSWLGNNVFKPFLPPKAQKSDFELIYSNNSNSTCTSGSLTINTSSTWGTSNSIYINTVANQTYSNMQADPNLEEFFEKIGIEIKHDWFGKYSIDAENLKEILEDEEKLKYIISKIKNKAFW